MIIEYSRSSSINALGYCEQSYFMTYNLGFQQEPNVKTVKGTATHKVLEWLAIGKKYLQDNPKAKVIEFGDGLSCKTIDFLSPVVLTDAEVDAINKSRTNKSIYKTVQPLLYGATRYGTDVLNNLVEESCNMYQGKTKAEWTRADRRDVGNWSWMAVEYNNGAYDPRRTNIECPERQFDLDINCDWAKSGDSQYSIKGTIDLITRVDDKTLEIVDYKTGQRLDWATGEVKTYGKLCTDMQLMLYYYAASRLYPLVENIYITIFFVRDGGPFTICFEPKDKKIMEERLKEHYFKVKNCTLPKMVSPDQSDFRCNRLCTFFKNKWEGSNKNQCRFIHDELHQIGMDKVIEKHKVKDFDAGFYQSPGA